MSTDAPGIQVLPIETIQDVLPPKAERSRRVVVAVDCDRTLTGPDLVPDAAALAAITDLRAAGVVCILVTGRTQQDLAQHAGIEQAFDAYVLEGGASWGPWDDQWNPGNANIVLDAAARVKATGIHVEVGGASFSIARSDLEAAKALAPECSFQPNVDRVDVVPPGLDKGVGLEGALGRMGLRAAQVFAVGDGENDLPLFDRADVALAVANAHPSLKDVADEVLGGEGPKGLVEAAQRILHGEWAFDPPREAP